MSQIVVEELVKTFRIAERSPGIWGALRGVARRRYRTVSALDGVSFEIEPGELVGYIGPNGAGKSTTVKVISGILVPDSGRCEILGLVPWRERVAHVRSIGVVFGQRTQLWWDLPVIESFELLRDIYRVSPEEYRGTLDELVQVLDLEPLLDVPVRQLSLGQRMRCDLAAALLHRPSILFLDEPTIGLDAVSKLGFRDFIKRFNRERGVTVILTTHDMDDIEALCTRVMVIGEGRILSDGTLEALRESIAPERRLIVDLEEQDAGRGGPRGYGDAARGAQGPTQLRPSPRPNGRPHHEDSVAPPGARPVRREPADRGDHRPDVRRAAAMRAYGAVLSANVRTLLQYRAAAIAGFTTQIFWGLIRVMIFQAFFRSSTAAQPMTVDEVVTYIWLGQAFIMLLPWNTDREIHNLIRSGLVSYELLRPVDLYNLWFSRALAFRTAPTLLRAIPLLTLALLFFGMGRPASPAAGVAFALSMVGALLISCAFTTLVNVTMMWTVSGQGAANMAGIAVTIFTGMLVPIPFFPEWAQTIIEVMPFRGIVDTPYRLYLGHIPTSEALFHLGHQLAWTAALVLIGRWVLSRGLRRLVVQGG